MIIQPPSLFYLEIYVTLIPNYFNAKEKGNVLLPLTFEPSKVMGDIRADEFRY